MDALMLILLGMVVVICLLISIYTFLHNKMQDYVIRINEVEAIIDNDLRDKYDNINKCISIIKGIKELEKKIDEAMFDEFIRLKTKKISNFDLDRALVEHESLMISLKEKHKEIKDNEDLKDLYRKIEDNNDNLSVHKEYYNKNIAEYNKLITLFPTNIIAKIGKYEEKLFFDKKDMSDDDYNDFKLQSSNTLFMIQIEMM